MFRLHFLALLAATPLLAGPVLNESGDLRTLLETTPIPAAASPDKYQLPGDDQLAAFRQALQLVLDDDLASAADFAVSAHYEVVSYADTASDDDFALLREISPQSHWGGLYVIDRTPERTLVLENPHPLFDGALVPAIDVFLETNAIAYLQAGTHRNNSPLESDCDGTLQGEPYRISDMAHAPDSFFQAAHETIEARFARTVSLSFHGMAEDSDPADVVVSNGTPRQWAGNSLSRDLATRMNEILADWADTRIAVSHQQPGENPALSGSTNTQGRATNGSPDPCRADAPYAIFPERFIHLESDPDVRTGPSSNWAFVVQALEELIPLFSDPAPDLPTGDLTITELMPNPAQVGDSTGEYVELFNHTGKPIDMSGWSLVDRQLFTASFSGVIQPGDLFVVGVSDDLNGGAPGGAPDAVWTNSFGNFTLTNGGDTISVLDADGDLVALADYSDTAPFGNGTAMEIAIANAHPNGQTVETDHLESTTPFAADEGSPGTRGDSQFPLFPTPVEPIISGNPADLTLAFDAAAAVTYALTESTDLGSWSDTVDLLIGQGTPDDFTFPLPPDPAGFYQLDFDYAAPQ